MSASRTSTVRLLSRGKFPWLVPGCTRASDDDRVANPVKFDTAKQKLVTLLVNFELLSHTLKR